MPNPFLGGRYHSLIVDASSIPAEMEISAWSEDGHIMGCRAPAGRVEGVLFHPESFLTEHSGRLFQNFLQS
jgi:anthranilate synthase component 2